jgi:hypothetical protein
MSDRCYLMIHVHRDDVKALTAILDGGEGDDPSEWDADDDGVVTIEDIEANYALGNARQLAAEAGIPFYGHHGEGGDFGPYLFASVNGQQIEHETGESGHPVISVHSENGGMIDSDAFEMAKRFLIHRRMAERVVCRMVCKHCGQPECDLDFGACDEAQAGGF